MHVAQTATLPARRAPVPAGPIVRPLLGPLTGTEAVDSSEPVAVLEVSLPSGAAMPEHDHGSSRVTLIPLQGRVRLTHDRRTYELDPATVATIEIGERVSLANPGPEGATLIVVATPSDFVSALANWPVVEPADTEESRG